MRDDAFGEADSTGFVLSELAAEDCFDEGRDAASFDENFESAGDDVMLDLDAEGFVVGFEEAGLKLVKHFWQTGIEPEASAEFTESGVGGAIDAEAVEQQLHVGEFVVEPQIFDEFVRLFPKRAGIDAERGKNDLFLHVVGAEGEVVVVDDGDRVLWCGHGARWRFCPRSEGGTSGGVRAARGLGKESSRGSSALRSLTRAAVLRRRDVPRTYLGTIEGLRRVEVRVP